MERVFQASDQALPRGGPSLGVPSLPDQGRPLNPKDSLQAGPQPSLHTGIPEAGPRFLSLQIPPPCPHTNPWDPWGRLPAFVPHRHSGDKRPPSSPGLTLHRNPSRPLPLSSGLPPNRDPGGRPPAPSPPTSACQGTESCGPERFSLCTGKMQWRGEGVECGHRCCCTLWGRWGEPMKLTLENSPVP